MCSGRRTRFIRDTIEEIRIQGGLYNSKGKLLTEEELTALLGTLYDWDSYYQSCLPMWPPNPPLPYLAFHCPPHRLRPYTPVWYNEALF